MRITRYCIGVLLAVLWTAPLAAQGPTGTIRGKVTDQASQRALQGATVSVGSRVTATRADGQYVLSGVPAGSDSLRVRMIGYAPSSQLVTVGAGEVVDLDVGLTAQAVNLSEMVVVGYGEQQAGNITGAVSQVNSDQFNQGQIITPTELIQNKVAGVQVVDNNEPGGGISIRIRGPSSVTASSDPLIVVDGMPLGSSGAGGGISAGRDPLNFINPNDIESMTVLRDASAAAIYGANAANGVILITTKSGRGHTSPVVEYSGSVSAATVTRVPSMLNAAQFRAAVTQYAPGSVSQLGTANTNWFDQVDRTGYGLEQNVAVAGSGQSSDYRLSLNYSDQNGIMDYTRVRQVNLGLNYNQNLFNDRMTVRTNLRGSREWDRFTPGGVISNAAQMGPTQPVFDGTTPTGYYNWNAGIQSASNPVEILNNAVDEGTTYRSVGNVLGTYRLPFLDGLKANLNLGFDATKATRTTFTSGLLHDEIRNSRYGRFYQTNPSQLNTLLDAYLDYAIPRKVGPGTLDLTGGYSYTQSHSEYPSIEADSLAINNLGISGIPASKTTTPLLFINDSKLISFFGRANYNINDKYLLAATIRHDGSSRFGPSHAWGTFPSVSAAWRLSEEPFLKSVDWISDLKLRASWARTGNQSFGDYLQTVSYTVGNSLGQQWLGNGFYTTIRPSGVDNNIKWEATRAVDIGVDYGFKNERFSGSIDWFDKKTTDLLFYLPTAPGTCVCDYITTNVGSMRDRG
ncbi:MAG TPA: SusC/RagA family TonB-linked outer membrane protein, partial [Gemmatimonadales bacterium]|nr:SusC/RagA family TonB-linked outer membrane protein [Gemmatimonadales bacterium]